MTAPLTPAERKAAQRQRQREQGLVKLELWAPPDQHAAIRTTGRAVPGTEGDRHVRCKHRIGAQHDSSQSHE
jgi:hypothetical protein